MRGNFSASVHRLRTNTVYGRGCVLGCVRTLSLSLLPFAITYKSR